MAKRGHHPEQPLNDKSLDYIGGKGLPPIPGIDTRSGIAVELLGSNPAAELGIDGLRSIVEAAQSGTKPVFGPASDAFRRTAQAPPPGVNRVIYRNRENIADL